MTCCCLIDIEHGYTHTYYEDDFVEPIDSVVNFGMREARDNYSDHTQAWPNASNTCQSIKHHGDTRMILNEMLNRRAVAYFAVRCSCWLFHFRGVENISQHKIVWTFSVIPRHMPISSFLIVTRPEKLMYHTIWSDGHVRQPHNLCKLWWRSSV